MVSQTVKLAFLGLIEEHDGQWGWYQFERAFPPGWFAAEEPTTRAKDILDRLEAEGLVTTIPDQARRNFRLTNQGLEALREGSIGSASA